jgi:hypothetical protein
MRLPLIFATLLLVAQIPPSATNQQKQTAERNAVAQQPSAPMSTPVTVTVNQVPSSPEKTEHTDQQASNWIGNLISLALVGVAFWGTKIAARSLKAIEDQAKFTEKAANAASDNARAVIDAERAWIVVDLELKPGTGTIHTTLTAQSVSVSVLLKCRNEGRTMAWIIEKWADAVPFTVIRDNPDFSDKSKIFQHAIQALPAGKKEDFGYSLYFNVPNNSDSRGPILIYGYIKYRTIFQKRDGETRFAFILTPMNNLDTLPPEHPQYNAST